METIIQHTEAFLTRIYEKINTGITDVDELSSDIFEDCRELARNIVQEAIIQMNESLRADKQTRKELGLTLKEKDRPRVLLTKLGELNFNRDCYFNKKTNHCEMPLDKMISVEKYTRVGDAVSAELVTLATEVSYAKSTNIATGGKVSRQTVKNQIQRAPLLEMQPDEAIREAKILDVYADEDHVHMQKPGKEKGKKNKIVPLVTVTEGIENVCKNRNRTINSMHFVDENFDSSSLWESVEGYIEKAYDLNKLESVRIHADGGSWIKNGLETFANKRHVMDGYHLQKWLKKIDRIFKGKNVRKRLNQAIQERNYLKAESIISGLLKSCTSAKDAKSLQELMTYLGSNWEAIVNRYEEDMTGSCTEGQVSHVLSERFSRNPMGWSEAGLGKLAKLRVYTKNGGKITSKQFKKDYEANESYRQYAEKYLAKPENKYDFSWIENMNEIYIPDTTSGTQQAIRNLGRMRDRFLS